MMIYEVLEDNTLRPTGTLCKNAAGMAKMIRNHEGDLDPTKFYTAKEKSIVYQAVKSSKTIVVKVGEPV